MPVGQPEFVDNPEPRCPVILLLDTSGSMQGDPIKELNLGISTFQESVMTDPIAALRVEVAIISFGGTVKILHDFTSISEFSPSQLVASGGTPMGAGIIEALDLLDSRKKIYRDNGIHYYQPWLFMITDGAPTDSWKEAAQRLQEAEASKKLSFFAVAVEGADIKTLKQIAPPTRPPLLLNGLNFKNMFIWLSQSMSRVSSGRVGGGMIDLPPVVWGKVPL